MKVSEIMTSDPITLKAPGTRDDLFELIRKHNVTSFPVVKEGTKQVIGIITETDIVQKPSETQLALLMTKNPITTTKNTDVVEIVNILDENRFRQIPVVEKSDLIGMISIGDIISKVIAIAASDKIIEEYMATNVLSVWQDTPLPVCQKIMEFGGVEAAIVLDSNGKMVGIITTVDFVKFFDAISSESRSDMTAGEGKEGSWDAVSTIIVHTKDLKLPNIPVKEVMTKDIVTTFNKATISDVAKKMRAMEIYQIPVVNAKGDVIGIIRDFDLLKAYAKK